MQFFALRCLALLALKVFSLMLPASLLRPLCRGIVLATMFLLRFVVVQDKILLYEMGQSIQNQIDNSFFNVQLQHNFLREGEKERLCNGTFGTNCCSNLRLMTKLEPLICVDFILQHIKADKQTCVIQVYLVFLLH